MNEFTWKAYVPVEVAFSEDGTMLPLSLELDGIRYEIDKVVDVCPRPATRAGGQGDRYEVLIRGKRSYLFFERSPDVSTPVVGQWFVELKRPRPVTNGRVAETVNR